jgi:hypothetical protein
VEAETLNEHIDAESKSAHIPIIGRLTPWELAGFLGLAALVALAALFLEITLPMGKEISAPGSGGFAQMLLFMVVYMPMLMLSASMFFSATIGFVLLLIKVRNRLGAPVVALAPKTRPSAAEVERLVQRMAILTGTFVILLVCNYLPLLLSASGVLKSDSLLTVLGAAGMAASVAFLTCLGMLASQLGRKWAVWVVLTIVTPPFGPIFAYILMRGTVKQAIGSAGNAGRG